jgi:hypothetical protein
MLGTIPTLSNKEEAMSKGKFFPVVAVLLGVLTLALMAGTTTSKVSASYLGSPDDDEIEFSGTVDIIDGKFWQIDGKIVTVTASTEIDGIIDVGDEVKVEVWSQEDGTLVVHEISLWPEDELNDDETFDDDSDDDSSDDSYDDYIDDDDDLGNYSDDDHISDDDDLSDDSDDDSMGEESDDSTSGDDSDDDSNSDDQDSSDDRDDGESSDDDDDTEEDDEDDDDAGEDDEDEDDDDDDGSIRS